MIDRSQYLEEIKKNPDLMHRLAVIVAGEVGSSAPLEKQTIMAETIFNRARDHGLTLEQATRQAHQTYPDGKGGYYPASAFTRGESELRQGNTEARMREQVFKPVLAGSDVGTQKYGFTPNGNVQAGSNFASKQIAGGAYTKVSPAYGDEHFVQERGPAATLAQQVQQSQQPPQQAPQVQQASVQAQQAPPRPPANVPEQGAIRLDEGKAHGYARGNVSVEPWLVDSLKQATRVLPPGYHAEVISTVDPRSYTRGGQTFSTPWHPGGKAIDIQIYDQNNRPIPNKGGRDVPGYDVYENMAAATKAYAQDKYPDKTFTWGGHFSQNSLVPADRMHFQSGGSAAGGSFSQQQIAAAREALKSGTPQQTASASPNAQATSMATVPAQSSGQPDILAPVEGSDPRRAVLYGPKVGQMPGQTAQAAPAGRQGGLGGALSSLFGGGQRGAAPPGSPTYRDPTTGHTIVNPSNFGGSSGEGGMGLTRDLGRQPLPAAAPRPAAAPASRTPAPASPPSTPLPPTRPAGATPLAPPGLQTNTAVPDILAPQLRTDPRRLSPFELPKDLNVPAPSESTPVAFDENMMQRNAALVRPEAVSMANLFGAPTAAAAAPAGGPAMVPPPGSSFPRAPEAARALVPDAGNAQAPFRQTEAPTIPKRYEDPSAARSFGGTGPLPFGNLSPFSSLAPRDQPVQLASDYSSIPNSGLGPPPASYKEDYVGPIPGARGYNPLGAAQADALVGQEHMMDRKLREGMDRVPFGYERRPRGGVPYLDPFTNKPISHDELGQPRGQEVNAAPGRTKVAENLPLSPLTAGLPQPTGDGGEMDRYMMGLQRPVPPPPPPGTQLYPQPGSSNDPTRARPPDTTGDVPPNAMERQRPWLPPSRDPYYPLQQPMQGYPTPNAPTRFELAGLSPFQQWPPPWWDGGGGGGWGGGGGFGGGYDFGAYG